MTCGRCKQSSPRAAFLRHIFYLCTIFSYERFGSLIARKQTVPEEAHDGSVIRSRLREELRDAAATHHWDDLLREHGTPLMILDPDRAAAQYRLLQTQLPDVELHYAIKTMPHPAVINAVAACGGSFDVASTGEVDHVRSLGISMSRCIYTHPVKSRETSITPTRPIRRFVVDNPGEAHKFRGRPSDIEILVRLAFASPGAKSDLSVKFGVDASEAEQLVKDVVATGVRFVGFSFHVGSQSASVLPFGPRSRRPRRSSIRSKLLWAYGFRYWTSAAASR